MIPSKDFSQYKEQELILDYFGEARGRFLDIGAWEGMTFSNTRALVELGWAGTLVEPDPVSFVSLLTNCKDYMPQLELVNAALSIQSGLLKFYSSNGDALSSSDIAHCIKWQEGYNSIFHPLWVSAITIDQLLVAQPGPYDFVNLDVESTNWELLQTLPLREMKTQLVCVEYDDKLELMKEWLACNGLTRVLVANGTNLIMGV